MAEPPDQRLAVVDIDGVVADVGHRLHHVERHPKNWTAFFAAAPDDPPHPQGVELVRALERDHEVLFLTGRPEWCREDTVEWLVRHDLGGHRLVMRPDGDRRPAAALKVDLLRRHVPDRQIAIVIDDDPLVVDALQRAGYPVRRAEWQQRGADEQAILQIVQETEGRS